MDGCSDRQCGALGAAKRPVRGRSAAPAYLQVLAAGLLMLAGGLFALSGARASEAADPASVVGLWQSVSDVDGKPKSHIRIREVNGRLEGTVEYIINPARREAVCDLCRDDRKNQRVLGMTILRDAHRDGESWVEGNILDPENGKVYSCRLTLIDGGRRLNLRGYIGIPLIGRTQTWVRLETP